MLISSRICISKKMCHKAPRVLSHMLQCPCGYLPWLRCYGSLIEGKSSRFCPFPYQSLVQCTSERSKTYYFLNWKSDTKWEFGTLFSYLTVLYDRQRSSQTNRWFPTSFQISGFCPISKLDDDAFLNKHDSFLLGLQNLTIVSDCLVQCTGKPLGPRPKHWFFPCLPTQTLIASQPSQIFAQGLKHRKVDDYGFIAIILRLSRCASH